ncbi:MAG: prepilin-type N-terminal cleavage/methylation domain-containing protein, partial [Bdellovibrionales bacterium]|nr:prepilin-type N-terminal cleavage/methylation domain-containing protein [Bdellovibrionales bacterium]
MRASRFSRNYGFTLIEIAVAIAILGVALTTLVGLHSSYLNTYLREQQRVRAALFGKQLLTALELSNEEIQLGHSEES